MSAQSSLQGGSAGLTGSDEASPPSVAETPSPPPVAAIIIATPAVAPTKCNYRSCLYGTEVCLPCQNLACDKGFHLSCFKEKYGNVYMPKLKDGQVVCTKLCYKKVAIPPKLTYQNLAGLSSSDEDVHKNKDDSFDDDATEDDESFDDDADATMAQRRGGDTERAAKPSGVGKKNSNANLKTPVAKRCGSGGVASGYAKKSRSGPTSIVFFKGGREVTDSHAHLCDARAELVLLEVEKRRNEVEKRRNEVEKRRNEVEKLSLEVGKSRLDMRLNLINRCFDFVAKHPNMSKERIVKMVPAFAAIIDGVMDN